MKTARWIWQLVAVIGMPVMLSLTGCTSGHQQQQGTKQGIIRVIDGDGYPVVLSQPAQRIVTLSPHATELVYAIGAGEQIVATTRYSDYPAQAGNLPVVGDVHRLDIEKIISYRPDLIVLWSGGSVSRQVGELTKVGIPVYRTHPGKLADIPADMEKLGQLTGHPAGGTESARKWRNSLEELRRQYGNRQHIRVFYQVYDRPLYTVGGTQVIDEAITVCGGQNIFSDIQAVAPAPGVEAVLAGNPDVVISTGGMSGEKGLGLWRRFPMLSATRTKSLYFLDSDLISRPGPRMVQGVRLLCEFIDDARRKVSFRS